MLNYESLGTVGEGTYGLVIKARHKETGQLVAIKKFKESDDDEQVRKTALREVRILKQLRHDNVVNLLEVFRRKGKLYLVFEYVDRTILQDLERYPDGMDPQSVKQLMYQLVKAMEFCHGHNIIHRDVKPENMLISKNGALKLCDFGFARNLAGPGAKYTEYVSTRWYRAPELLVGDTQYGKAIDIWSVGCLIAEMLTGQPLFPGDSDIDQLFQIMECFGKLTPHFVEVFNQNPLFEGIQLPEINEKNLVNLDSRFPGMDENVLDLMRKCLRYDPRERPSCSDLLQHPYFEGFAEQFDSELKEIMAKDWSDLPQRKKKGRKEGKHRRNASDSMAGKTVAGDDSQQVGLNSSMTSSSVNPVRRGESTNAAHSLLQPNEAQQDSMRGSDKYATSDGATTDSQRPLESHRLPSLQSKTPVATRLTALPSLNAEVDDGETHGGSSSNTGGGSTNTTSHSSTQASSMHSRKKKMNYMPHVMGASTGSSTSSYSHHLQFGVHGSGTQGSKGGGKVGGGGGGGNDGVKMAGTGLQSTIGKSHQLTGGSQFMMNSMGAGSSRKKTHGSHGFGHRMGFDMGGISLTGKSRGMDASRGNPGNYNMHSSFAGKPPNYSFTGIYSKYRKPLGYNNHGR